MQMQAAAALRHHYSATYSSYAGNAQAQQRAPASSHAPQITRTHQQAPPQQQRMISSFQQITPPESLAFWQQQQSQLMQQMTCRSACSSCQPMCCPAAGCPGQPRYCYVMPPTPVITSSQAGQPFCIGCAQGKCQVNLNKENLGIMRSL